MNSKSTPKYYVKDYDVLIDYCKLLVDDLQKEVITTLEEVDSKYKDTIVVPSIRYTLFKTPTKETLDKISGMIKVQKSVDSGKVSQKQADYNVTRSVLGEEKFKNLSNSIL